MWGRHDESCLKYIGLGICSGTRRSGSDQCCGKDRAVSSRQLRRALPVGPDREGRGEPRMRLPKRRGGLPLLLSGSRQPGGAWQAPRRPRDSDRPVPVCGVRAFPVGPGREGRGEPTLFMKDWI